MSNKDYNTMAVEILELLGGKDNVKKFLHCMTRLRVTPINEENINIEEIEALDYVIKVQIVAGVIQIVLGPQTVDEVHDHFQKLVGQHGDFVDETLDDDTTFGMKIISALQAILLPAIGVLGGVALINAIATILVLLGVPSDNALILIFKTLGSIVTGYLGVYLAFNTSKYFKGSPFIGVTLALFIYSPNLTGIKYFGITLIQGIGGIIGIVAIVIIAAKIELYLKKIIKKELQLVFIPFLTILITLIPMLFLIIPISAALTAEITKIVNFVLYSNDFVFILANAILAGVWGLLVMSGLHISVMAAILPIANETGVSPLQVNFVMLAAALIGLTLAVMRKEKTNVTLKEVGISGMITALTGITEPLLYGIAMPRLRSMLYVIIGGFCGGLVNGLAHVETAFPASSGIFMTFSIVDFQSKWFLFILAWLVSGGVTFTLYTLFPVEAKKINKKQPKIN